MICNQSEMTIKSPGALFTTDRLDAWHSCSANQLAKQLAEITDQLITYNDFASVSIASRHSLADLFIARFDDHDHDLDHNQQITGDRKASPKLPTHKLLRPEIMRFLRILARDERDIDELVPGQLVDKILEVAYLDREYDQQKSEAGQNDHCSYWTAVIEAMVCLNNLLYNSAKARARFRKAHSASLLRKVKLCNRLILAETSGSKDHAIEGKDRSDGRKDHAGEGRNLSVRSANLSEENEVNELDEASKSVGILDETAPPKWNWLDDEQRMRLACFDIRIAFIVSAHERWLQDQWRSNDGGFDVFVCTLDVSLHVLMSSYGDLTDAQIEAHVDRAGWALKVLFNIYCYGAETTVATSADDGAQCLHDLARLCGQIICDASSDSPRAMTVTQWRHLEQSAADLLAVLPAAAELERLVPSLLDGHQLWSPPVVEFDGYNLTFVDRLLRAFERRMCVADSKSDDGGSGTGDAGQLLGTYLSALIKLSDRCEQARRYLRLQVIPPLSAPDVQRRPEVGKRLRNRLIRLMISSSGAGTSISHHLIAEFLFILCKRSVQRFLKYCGFGHAAGLLANYGYLGQLNAVQSEGHHSDSEDSETEDYRRVQMLVNPVTGCIEPPAPDPFAGMSEERKEFEVHRLMNDINRLMDHGVIRPGRIGDDGRLQPVEHVLELVDKPDEAQNSSPRSDLESDDQ